MKVKSCILDDKYKYLLDKYKFGILTNSKKEKFYYFTTINKKSIGIHRIIMSLETKDESFINRTKIYVDHINGNGLDNRVSNLRIATNSLNQINKRIQKNNTTGYKGVCFNKNSKKYTLRITTKEKKRVYIGQFESKHDAAIMYNKIVSGIWGNNVILNIIKR